MAVGWSSELGRGSWRIHTCIGFPVAIGLWGGQRMTPGGAENLCCCSCPRLANARWERKPKSSARGEQGPVWPRGARQSLFCFYLDTLSSTHSVPHFLAIIPTTFCQINDFHWCLLFAKIRYSMNADHWGQCLKYPLRKCYTSVFLEQCVAFLCVCRKTSLSLL